MNYKQVGWLIGGGLLLITFILFGVSSVKVNKQKDNKDTNKTTVSTTLNSDSHINTDLDIQNEPQNSDLENTLQLINADDLKHTSIVETQGKLTEKVIYVKNGSLFYVYRLTVEDISDKVEYFVSSDSFEKYNVNQVFKLEMYKTKDGKGNIYYSVKSLKV